MPGGSPTLPRPRSGAAASAGPEKEACARAAMSLLAVLPAASGDAAVAPLAARALQPLGVDSAPPVLRCVALRLTVQGWLET
eukprot:120129-Chlamydomonas_euryale.AAC.1